MSQKLLPGYRFLTEEQWKSCLFVGADRETKEARSGLRPFAPFAGPATRFKTKDAYAPAIADMSEVVWRDGERHLQRLPYGDDVPGAMAAPSAIAVATRLVATSTALWAASKDQSLQAFDVDSLARQFVADLPDHGLRDIASDGRDGIYALLARENACSIVHVDCAGQVTASFTLCGVMDASALVYLARPAKLVVLASNASKLYWFSVNGGSPISTVADAAVRPCFDVIALGSDGRARLFVAGADGAAFGGHHQILTLGSDGTLLGTIATSKARSSRRG